MPDSRNALAAVRRQAAQGLYAEAARDCLALLRQDPANIEANLEYGHLAIHLRRPQDAIIIFRKLLAIAPGHPVAHDRLAHLYQQSGDYASAAEHARAALQADPTLVESQLALAAAAVAKGEKAEALRLFARLRAQLQGDIHVEKAYAEALLRCGEFEAARALLRELIAQHPDDAFLYTLLGRTQKFDGDSPDTALLGALGDGAGALARSFAATDDQVHALMALFKLESDLGRPQLAFRYLRRAKNLRKQQIPYQPQSTPALHRQVSAAFTAKFFARPEPAGAAVTDPIFIVGMPRSGTTLLERVVCSHPEVSPAGELLVVQQLVQELSAHFGQNQNDFPALARVPADVWRQTGEEYVRRARRQVGGDRPFFTDKLPGNYLWVGFIRAMLPAARIIHLSRHPVANCLSIYEQDFASTHPWSNDLAWLGARYVAYRELMDYWRGLPGNPLIEVDYESLVSGTQACIAALGERLGLELTLEGLGASQQEGQILTASQWQARQAIHPESIARWQRLEAELQPLLAALAPVLPPR